MLSKILRLNKKYQYRAVFDCSKKYVSRTMVVYIAKNSREESGTQVGFIASKKIGNAVRRNRAKRLMREGVGHFLGEMKNPCQMICIARQAINTATLQDVERVLHFIWKKEGIL